MSVCAATLHNFQWSDVWVAYMTDERRLQGWLKCLGSARPARIYSLLLIKQCRSVLLAMPEALCIHSSIHS